MYSSRVPRHTPQHAHRIHTGELTVKLALLALAASLVVSNSASAQSSSEKATPQQHATPAQATPDPFANVPPAKPDDVKSVESLLAALYDVISGPAGERDWNRFRSLFTKAPPIGRWPIPA